MSLSSFFVTSCVSSPHRMLNFKEKLSLNDNSKYSNKHKQRKIINKNTQKWDYFVDAHYGIEGDILKNRQFINLISINASTGNEFKFNDKIFKWKYKFCWFPCSIARCKIFDTIYREPLVPTLLGNKKREGCYVYNFKTGAYLMICNSKTV